MIYPIVVFGHPVLKKKAEKISTEYEGLDDLIKNMYLTMNQASGVGLAAPQINKSIRLFIIDTTKMLDEEDREKPVKEVFINAKIVEQKGKVYPFEEGCLSIPHLREEVERPDEIEIHYHDQNFKEKKRKFSGLAARVIQHEYDHIEGILFTDRINPFRRKMIKSKLDQMAKGKVVADYPLKFYKKKR